jgi:hypothetical protein
VQQSFGVERRRRPCFVQPPVAACGRGRTSLIAPPAFRKQMIRQERQPTLDNQKMSKIGRMQSWIKRPDKSLQHKMLMKLLRHALFKQ